MRQDNETRAVYIETITVYSNEYSKLFRLTQVENPLLVSEKWKIARKADVL